ncbi:MULTISPECIES: hypothetical protein [Microbacterium]|uniref:hypothetical protein n=1 Tax=Microbacterium TaxID=33882 RepID=UPI0027886B46|nr:MULTISPECIES: hypothetical protein [Microbacterium]MDQ1082510.1 hypothetical protein [Microbacterium sp. SORGH_AS_0344]MDQ1168719.1 hypothetical protein [Microbacterium proteolyticum]
MSSRAGRAQRVGRGVAAASLATFVATVSHASVGAALPPVLNVVVALCLAVPVCVLLAGRALSWGRLSIAVVLSQALFHTLLALDLRSGDAPAGAGHHHVAAALVDAAAAPHLHAADAATSPWMWVAHAVAALVTIAAFGRGERAVQAVVRFLAAAIRALRPFSGLPPVGDATGPAPEPLLLTTAMTVLSPMRHRGPPLAA